VREERECSQGERGNQLCSNKERASGGEFADRRLKKKALAAQQSRGGGGGGGG
jgi:hypothetical protein